jgi:hypothetical protein
MYKEDITISEDSGEVTINGQPNFSYAKTYIIPKGSGEGGSVDVDSFAPKGYDLSSTDMLKYFWMRFIVETKVPANRFTSMPTQGGESPGGNSQGAGWSAGSETIAREEMMFDYFKSRVRAIYKDILLKPTWLQFIIRHPEFAQDQALKSALGLLFNEENLFLVAKQREIAKAGASVVSTMMGIKYPGVGPDGSPTEEPYFDPKFLIEKYMQYTDIDLKLNEKYKKMRQEQIQKLTAAYARLNAINGAGKEGGEGGPGGGMDMGGSGMDFGGGGGMDMGGGGSEDLGNMGGGEDTGDEAEDTGATELGA